MLVMDNIYVKKQLKKAGIKEGDVFYVEIGDGKKAYFQYLMQDHHYCNACVIRVFERHYKSGMQVEISDIVSDKVAFYTHVFLWYGIREGMYFKVGNSPISCKELDNVYFAKTDSLIKIEQDGEEQYIDVNPLENWYIWKVTGEKKNFEKVPEEIIPLLECCVVDTAESLIKRIRLGYYQNSDIEVI